MAEFFPCWSCMRLPLSLFCPVYRKLLGFVYCIEQTNVVSLWLDLHHERYAHLYVTWPEILTCSIFFGLASTDLSRPTPVPDVIAATASTIISESEADRFGTSININNEVRKAAVKLAEYVAKNGRSFEDVTRDRNPGDSPFRCVMTGVFDILVLTRSIGLHFIVSFEIFADFLNRPEHSIVSVRWFQHPKLRALDTIFTTQARSARCSPGNV